MLDIIYLRPVNGTGQHPMGFSGITTDDFPLADPTPQALNQGMSHSVGLIGNNGRGPDTTGTFQSIIRSDAVEK